MGSRPDIRLVVNADDFGSSPGANTAVLRSHRDGILTSASLLVSGDAAVEAAEIARAHPALGVGLHLALACARPSSAPPASRASWVATAGWPPAP